MAGTGVVVKHVVERRRQRVHRGLDLVTANVDRVGEAHHAQGVVLDVEQHVAGGAVPFVVRRRQVPHLLEDGPLHQGSEPRQVRQRRGVSGRERRGQIRRQPHGERLRHARPFDVALLREVLHHGGAREREPQGLDATVLLHEPLDAALPRLRGEGDLPVGVLHATAQVAVGHDPQRGGEQVRRPQVDEELRHLLAGELADDVVVAVADDGRE